MTYLKIWERLESLEGVHVFACTTTLAVCYDSVLSELSYLYDYHAPFQPRDGIDVTWSPGMCTFH